MKYNKTIILAILMPLLLVLGSTLIHASTKICNPVADTNEIVVDENGFNVLDENGNLTYQIVSHPDKCYYPKASTIEPTLRKNMGSVNSSLVIKDIKSTRESAKVKVNVTNPYMHNVKINYINTNTPIPYPTTELSNANTLHQTKIIQERLKAGNEYFNYVKISSYNNEIVIEYLYKIGNKFYALKKTTRIVK